MPVYEYEDKAGEVHEIYVPSWRHRDSVPDMKRIVSKVNFKIGTHTFEPASISDYEKSAKKAQERGWIPKNKDGKPYTRHQLIDAKNYHEAMERKKGHKRLVLA